MSVKKVFLVDYENVASAGAKGCEHLKKHDKIIIFISNKMISAKSAQAYINTKARLVIKHVVSGKPDALDFQLLAYVGVKCSNKKNKNKRYYIVSNDKSYEYGVNMFARLGFNNIQCVANISEALAEKTDLSVKQEEIVSLPESKETVDKVSSADEIQIEETVSESLSETPSECETKSNSSEIKTKSSDASDDVKPNAMSETGLKKIMTILRDKCKISYDAVVYLSIMDSIKRTRNKMGLFNSLRYKYPSGNAKCDVYTAVSPHYDELKQALQSLDLCMFDYYSDISKHISTYRHKLNELMHFQYSPFVAYMIIDGIKHSQSKVTFVRYIQSVYYNNLSHKMPSWYNNIFKKEFPCIQQAFCQNNKK